MKEGQRGGGRGPTASMRPIAAPPPRGYAHGVTAGRYRAVLERIEEIAPDTRAFFLRLPPGRGLEFEPGQFLSLSLPVGTTPIVRAYSLASDPESPELLEIRLNRVPRGPGSEYLFALDVGAELDFSGP